MEYCTSFLCTIFHYLIRSKPTQKEDAQYQDDDTSDEEATSLPEKRSKSDILVCKEKSLQDATAKCISVNTDQCIFGDIYQCDTHSGHC